MGEFESWGGFYSFVGTAAATLMGLVFVVVSLGKGLVGTERATRAVRAFYTPLIAFFSTDILAATVALIPHVAPKTVGFCFGIIAASGLIYMATSGAFSEWRSSELPFDDLLFYVMLPFVAYIALFAASASLWSEAPFALNLAAAVMILLLVIGIRNAWDLVLTIARQDTD